MEFEFDDKVVLSNGFIGAMVGTVKGYKYEKNPLHQTGSWHQPQITTYEIQWGKAKERIFVPNFDLTKIENTKK